MWILSPDEAVSSELEAERIQSQNLGQTLRKTILLLPAADNVVGRMPKAPTGNVARPFRPILIQEQSISGSHASLTFDRLADIGQPDHQPTVTLTDQSSFGTWVNGEKVHRATKVCSRIPCLGNLSQLSPFLPDCEWNPS